MGDVGVEADLLIQYSHEWLSNIDVNADDFATPIAHQVNMRFVFDCVVGRSTMTDVCVADKADFFKHFKCSVDRGEIDAGSSALHFDKKFIWCRVTQRFNCFEHQLPLRGDAVTACTQTSLPLARVGRGSRTVVSVHVLCHDTALSFAERCEVRG